MKAQRKAKGFSQAEMARQLDVTQQTYARYETGERQPSPDVLPKISDILEISLDDLLRPALTEKNTPREVIEMPSSENWAEIIKNLTDTLKLEAENTRLRIEKVEAKEAEARIIAERNVTMALEEARASRLAAPQPPHHADRPDEEAVSNDG